MAVHNITPLMKDALQNGYAVGSFSARSTLLIEAILNAAEKENSPVIVQISANELLWFSITPEEFAQRFYALQSRYSIPMVLHLDHTKDFATIQKAVEAGFTSVMIDASHLPFEENISLTAKVVEYAHLKNVTVEAELGQIGGADKLETGHDTELYTNPTQAAEFIQRTGADILAVSVGTAHGVYPVKNPVIQFSLIEQIRHATGVPLVLHGGSGLPAETMIEATRRGIAKINIATDLEKAFLAAVEKTDRLSNAEIEALSPSLKARGIEAVQYLVQNRMQTYLSSSGQV